MWRFRGSASDYVKELAPPDVDDAGAPGLDPEPAPAHHQVLVEAQRRHLRDPPGVRVQQSPAPTLHRKVDGVPPTAQLRGRVLERAAPPRLACSPPRRARRQQRPRRRDLAGRLSDSARPTARLAPAPPALVPHQPRWPTERREVHQHHRPLTVGPQRPPTAPTRRARRPATHMHPQRPAALVADAEHLPHRPVPPVAHTCA